MIDIQNLHGNAFFLGHPLRHLAPQAAGFFHASVFHDDGEQLAARPGHRRRGAKEAIDLRFHMGKDVLDHPAMAGILTGPRSTLVNAADVIADDHQIDDIDMPGRETACAGDRRFGPDGADLVIEIEPAAKIVNVSTAGRPGQHRPTVSSYLLVKSFGVGGQARARAGIRAQTLGTLPHHEFRPAARTDCFEHLQSRGDDLAADPLALDDAQRECLRRGKVAGFAGIGRQTCLKFPARCRQHLAKLRADAGSLIQFHSRSPLI